MVRGGEGAEVGPRGGGGGGGGGGGDGEAHWQHPDDVMGY